MGSANTLRRWSWGPEGALGGRGGREGTRLIGPGRRPGGWTVPTGSSVNGITKYAGLTAFLPKLAGFPSPGCPCGSPVQENPHVVSNDGNLPAPRRPPGGIPGRQRPPRRNDFGTWRESRSPRQVPPGRGSAAPCQPLPPSGPPGRSVVRYAPGPGPGPSRIRNPRAGPPDPAPAGSVAPAPTAAAAPAATAVS